MDAIGRKWIQVVTCGHNGTTAEQNRTQVDTVGQKWTEVDASGN
jgi:hypothetical protein